MPYKPVQMPRRHKEPAVDNRIAIGKCAECGAPVKVLLKDRLLCFDCYDKGQRDKGFGPRFMRCIRHPGTDQFLISEGCPRCATVTPIKGTI